MTRSHTRRSGSSSQLVSLESVEKKKRKTKAKTGGATKKINKEEEGEEEAVESADEEDDDDAAAEEEEAEEEDEDSEKKKIVIEHCYIETKQPNSKVKQLFKEPIRLVSSFQRLKGHLPVSDPLLCMYTSSNVSPTDSDSRGLFLPKSIKISGMPKNTTYGDIARFFKKKDIHIESVELESLDEGNLFRKVVTKEATVVFKSAQDANTAFKMSGELMKVEQEELPVFVSRLKNDFRIIHVSGLDEIAEDYIGFILTQAFTEERLVKYFVPEGSGFGYVLVLADYELIASLMGGSYEIRFSDLNDYKIIIREAASLKPDFMKTFLSDEILQKMQQMEKDMQEKMQRKEKKKSGKRRKRNT